MKTNTVSTVASLHWQNPDFSIWNWLVITDYGEEKKKKEEKKEEVTKSQEEKRKHIKTLIDKIPTEKTALFAFQLDWAAVDNVSTVYAA